MRAYNISFVIHFLNFGGWKGLDAPVLPSSFKHRKGLRKGVKGAYQIKN